MVKTISQIMSREVVTLEKHRKVKEAVDVMTQKSISCVVITDQEKPVGIVTERDMVKKVLHKELSVSTTSVGEVMSSPLITVPKDIDIFSASELMKKKKIRRLVIEVDGKLGGLITENDIGGLIADLSVRSIFHKSNVQKDMEIAKLQSELKDLKRRKK